MSNIDDKIEVLLENFTLEELLDMSNLSVEEVIRHLYRHGLFILPFEECEL